MSAGTKVVQQGLVSEACTADDAGLGVLGELSAEHRELMLWYLICYRSHSNSDHKKATEGDWFESEKMRLDHGMRTLAARSLVRAGGVLERGHPFRAFLAVLRSLLSSSFCVKSIAIRQARQDYVQQRDEFLLRNLPFECFVTAYEQDRPAPQLLQAECELLESRCVYGFASAQKTLVASVPDLVASHVKDLLLRAFWTRYGPVFLLALSTVLAFTVSTAIWWHSQRFSVLEFLQAWLNFLFN